MYLCNSTDSLFPPPISDRMKAFQKQNEVIWVFKRGSVPRSSGNICSVWRTVSIAPCWQSRSTAPEQSARADRTFRPLFWITELLMNCTHRQNKRDFTRFDPCYNHIFIRKDLNSR